MKSQQTIQKGNQAVVINEQDGYVWANLYVNVRNGMADANITATRWTGKTVNGAKRWAEKVMN